MRKVSMNSRSPGELVRLDFQAFRACWLWPTWVLPALFIFTVAANASAHGSVAVYVDGPGGEDIRSELLAALPPETTVIDSSKLLVALAQRQIDDVEKAVLAARTNQAMLGTFRKASASIGADAVILGAMRAGKGKRPPALVLLVVLSSQDTAAGGASVTVPIKKGANRSEQWRKILAPPLEGLPSATAAEPVKKAPETKIAPEAAAAPSEETAKPEASASPERSDDAKGSATTITDALFVGFVGLNLGGRQFFYNQRVTANTLSYSLPSGVLLPETPGVAASAEVFPLARGQGDIVRDIGLSARFNTDFAKVQVGSVVANTQWYAWELDVRGRIPLGPRASSPFIGVEGGGGQLAFTFPNVSAKGFNNGSGSLSDSLPGVDYTYLRLGADGRVPFGNAALLIGAAYRVVLGAGPLGDHFPRSSIGGLDAKVGGSLRITSNIEARIVFSYIRFWAAFNPHVGDTYVAGGGLDQFLNADLGVAAFF
jgi:hypothetical protein